MRPSNFIVQRVQEARITVDPDELLDGEDGATAAADIAHQIDLWETVDVTVTEVARV